MNYKKLQLFFIMVFASVAFTSAVVVDYGYDGFEDGWNNFQDGWLGPWSHQGNSKIVQSGAFAGGHSLKLRGPYPSNPGIVKRYFNLTTLGNLDHISFYVKVDSFEGDDFASFIVGNDAGYGTYYIFNATLSDGVWRQYDIDLSNFIEGSNPYIEFRAYMNENTDFFNIDEIYIE